MNSVLEGTGGGGGGVTSTCSTVNIFFLIKIRFKHILNTDLKKRFNPEFFVFPTVPSSVPMMHQLSRAPDSITLSWPQPDRPNGDILEYQLRYYDKVLHKYALGMYTGIQYQRSNQSVLRCLLGFR